MRWLAAPVNDNPSSGGGGATDRIALEECAAHSDSSSLKAEAGAQAAPDGAGNADAGNDKVKIRSWPSCVECARKVSQSVPNTSEANWLAKA